MKELSQMFARKIIETVGSNGIPPEGGFEYFTVGLDNYMKIFKEEYLASYIKEGGSAFKLVIGAYGGGKTHFLYSIRDLAWRTGYVVSYVTLSSNDAPFSKLDRVYGSITKNLIIPLTTEQLLSGYNKGFAPVLNKLVEKLDKNEITKETLSANLNKIENTNYLRAVESAIESAKNKNKDDLTDLLQWLNADGYDANIHKKYKILQPIARGNAFSMIRSLVQFVKSCEFSGLVILFDEAEALPSLSTREKDIMLSNLRELVDCCAEANFGNVLIFYAVPDENFLEGKTHVYEALKQRLHTVFNFLNPSAVKINLEDLTKDPTAFLVEIGKKLFKVFNIAYPNSTDATKADELVEYLAPLAYKQRFGDIGYKRLFVQAVIRGFNYLRLSKTKEVNADLALKVMLGETLE